MNKRFVSDQYLKYEILLDTFKQLAVKNKNLLHYLLESMSLNEIFFVSHICLTVYVVFLNVGAMYNSAHLIKLSLMCKKKSHDHFLQL